MRANTINNQTNFKALSPFASSLGAFHNANATIPTLAIETGVTLGRSFEANKRGGKIEATERFVEQGISALVWIYGVQTLKKMGDFVGKNIPTSKEEVISVRVDEFDGSTGVYICTDK